jgi:hypothetical protein
MFNYDYVNMPGTGRPWPLATLYGDRYEYGAQILVITLAATLATIAIVVLGRRQSAADQTPPVEPPPPSQAPGTEDPYRANVYVPPPSERLTTLAPAVIIGSAIAFLALLVVACELGPSLPRGTAPTIGRWLWLGPTACMVPFTVMFVRCGLDSLRGVRGAILALSLVGVLWTSFLIDKIFVELSPHWAQKHVIAAYYANRRSPEEKLIAWQLYWRGENFYTKNEIYKDSNPLERTVFLGDRNVEKMQKWFSTHKGQRVFFVVERVRYDSLRGVLPMEARPTLQIVDQSNNKLYLVVAQL